MAEQAKFATVINLDVQDSGRVPDQLRPAMRAELYRVTGEALQRARIADSQVHREDRGDGILFVLGPAVPPQAALGPWLEHLHQGLRLGNRNARDVLRLRVGMSTGPVTADPHGRSGHVVDLACRLGNSEEAKRLLRAAPAAPLLVALSDPIYRDWVGQGGQWIDPAHYRPHRVQLPEGGQTAWFRLMGAPAPAEPAAPTGVEPPARPDSQDRPEEPARRRGLRVHGDNHGPGTTVTAAVIHRMGRGGGDGPATPMPDIETVSSDGHGSGFTITAGVIDQVVLPPEGGTR